MGRKGKPKGAAAYQQRQSEQAQKAKVDRKKTSKSEANKASPKAATVVDELEGKPATRTDTVVDDLEGKPTTRTDTVVDELEGKPAVDGIDEGWGDIIDAPKLTAEQLKALDEQAKNAGMSERQVYQASTSYLLETGYESAGAVASEEQEVSAGSMNTREVFKKNTPNGVNVVTPPATDCPGKTSNYGIAQALKDGLYAAGDKRPATISIKVSQERQMVPRIAKALKWFSEKINSPRLSRLAAAAQRGRDHWTYLQVKIDKDGKVTAQHMDSQARWKHVMYNLDPIKKAVKEVFPDAKFTSKTTATQKDLTNCGRYVIAHEVAAIEGTKIPKDPLKYARETLKVNERYNNFGEEVLAKRADVVLPTLETQKQAEQRVTANLKLAEQNKTLQHEIQGPEPRQMTHTEIETAAKAKYGEPAPKEKTSRVKFAEESTTIVHEVDRARPTGDHGKERSGHAEDRAIASKLVEAGQYSYDPQRPIPKSAIGLETKLDTNLALARENATQQMEIQGTRQEREDAIAQWGAQDVTHSIEERAVEAHGAPAPKEKTSRVKFAEESTTIVHEVDRARPTGDHGKERSGHTEDKAIASKLVETVQKHSSFIWSRTSTTCKICVALR